MTDINIVMVGGRLTKDPVLKYSADGIPVTSFSMTVNRKWTKADGTTSESAVYVTVSTRRRLAELCKQFLKKGRSVLVIGRLNQTNWIDKEGQKRSKVRVTADTIQFLNGQTKTLDSCFPLEDA